LQAAAEANYATSPIPQVPVNAFRVIGGLTFANVSGNPAGLWQKDTNNVMPRIGFAYQLDPRTVLRGGYGIFFDQLGITRTSVIQSGFSRTTQFVPSLDNGLTFATDFAHPFPQGLDRALGASQGLLTFAGQSISFVNPNLVNPYMQRWQFSVEHQFGNTAVVEVAYVGNRGTKLLLNRQFDPIPAQFLSTSPVRDQATINLLSSSVSNPFYPLLPRTNLAGTTVALSQLLRPYPQFTGITANQNQGSSWYHSLQTRFEKRLSAGYTVSGSWTWSKFMQATELLNDVDPVPYRVISDQDRTHRIVVNGLWELPVGKGKRFLPISHGFASKIVSGWQSQAIYQWQSGPPLGFGNIIFNGNLKDIALPGDQQTATRWFNTGAGFVTSSASQLASNIRTFPLRFSGIRGDGLNNWDISLFKNTQLTESVRLQFRTEFVNAFNHTQFAAPNTTVTSTAFGRVTAESQWPRTIQFGLKLQY
jgi:hypothetical protein